MPVTYQKINELLASKTSPQGEIKTEIRKAENYLKSGKGEKPDWLDEFFESNENKLKETILRAISSSEGISSLSGYNEGYFNEIIQNANDLHVGDTIDITVRKNDTIYSVECRYRDKGFVLSNIYGFLNREMSDKSSDEGQTGKFGIGIKSFFKFVRKFRIESNVIFDFIINREQCTVEGQVYVNEKWDKQNTVLYFDYDENEASDSSFNISKLSKFIELLDEEPCVYDEEIERFFVSGEDKEIIFDIRSMIFMNKNPNKLTVKKMSFSGERHTVTINCQDSYNAQEIDFDESKWLIRNVGLKISLDDEVNEQNDYEYVVFKNAKISIGIPLTFEAEEDNNNRFYSTYYIKTDIKNEFFPTGMIIDSSFANIHRNDLGDSEKEIEEAYDKIRDVIIKAMYCMCSPQISSLQFLDDISNAFHHILFMYLDADRDQYEESPFNIIDLDNQYLPKISGDMRTDVVVHKVVENYQKSTPLDCDSVNALTDLYFECIERDNVVDYDELKETNDCISNVSLIYGRIALDNDSDNNRIARKMLHYFSGVAEYITYAISGEYRENATLTDVEIDYWLCRLKEELKDKYEQNLCLKLIGRYQLNDALAFDGSPKKENLSFKDYLFNGMPELADGVMSNWQNEQYDKKYSELKKQLLGNRFQDVDNTHNKNMIRYMEPNGTSRRGWDGSYDCYCYQQMHCDVSDSNKLLLLEKIALDITVKNSLNNYRYQMWLFERKPVSLRVRSKYFAHYTLYEQQIVCLDFLESIRLDNYGDFLKALDYRKKIKECFCFGYSITISCYQSEINTHDIANVFLPQLVGLNESDKKIFLLSEYSDKDVIVKKVVEDTNNELPKENIVFIRKVSGYRIHICRFDSNSKKHVIAYLGDHSAKIKMEAGAQFKPFATYLSSSKDIYVFYDNIADINVVASSVIKDLGLSRSLMELLLGYIHNGNDTKTMNYFSRRRTFARIKRNLILDWADFSFDEASEIDDVDIIYRLLTARGSYDIYCPICADIPLETFDYGEDTKKKHSRRIMVLENENPDTKKEYPYIITVACSYCFEKLRNTLSKSEFDGKRLTLTTIIAHGQHEKMKSRHQLELSPMNIVLMKKIKFGN